MADINLKQIIASEYQKCVQDPIYFFSKYCMIQHPTKGRLHFNLYPFQRRTFEEITSHDKNIILKSRQMGISTLMAGYSLWLMVFNKDINVVVIATKQEVAKNLITKVRFMYQNLPSWMRMEVKEDNKLNLRLSNGSQVKATSAADDAGRSEAVSVLVVDEAAFIANIETIWGGIYPTLSTGGRVILLSTPNGLGNFFHKQWVTSSEQKFNRIRLHWSMHPERDQSWRDEQDSILGPKLAAQECDASFISSGNSVIDMEILKYYKEHMIKNPIEKRGVDRNLWIWEQPQFGRDYIVSADVARGDGNDSSAFHVLDVETMEQVAEYKGKIDTKAYGNMLVSIATEYNDAVLVIENGGIGWSTVQQAIDRGYKNLFYMEEDMKYVDPQKKIINRYRQKERKQVAGFSTSVRTRPLIISKMEEYFRDQSVNIRSERCIDELTTFIWNGQKAEAMNGYNDDITMALAIGLWVRDTALQMRTRNIQIQKKALDNIVVTSPMDPIYLPGQGPGDQWRIDTPDGKKEDIDWLI